MLSENGDVIKNRHDRAPDHSTLSIQNGGQTLPCGFNFAPISGADILKYAILVPRGRALFGQHQESRPLAGSNDIPGLNGFVNTID